MSRRRKAGSPKDAFHISTYRQLEEFISAFAAGHINLLIVVGAPGLAKSRTVRGQLGQDACWIEGNATPFGMYAKLYRYRDKFVVIDDVDSLYADRNGVRLLKCLCQTESEKSVAWHSAARTLEREVIPRESITTSRVIIICNDWKTLNRNVVALQDRGHTLVFEPTAEEVHEKTGEWFTEEPDIYKWFGDNLRLVKRPSMRTYLRAAELKRAGMDWMNIVPMATEDQRQRLVAELQANDSYSTQESRSQEFTARGGGCRATYFNLFDCSFGKQKRESRARRGLGAMGADKQDT